VSETVAALSELLDAADKATDRPTSYLIGQLAAELIGSASDAELSQMIVATHRQSGPSESLLPMLSGLLQGVLADRQAAGQTGSLLTVRERVLNLLAIEPRNPTRLSTEIGCSIATASRALRRLHDSGLVKKAPTAEHSDRRHVVYQLTDNGQKRQLDHFFGRLEDDPISEDKYEDEDYDYDQPLAQLIQLVADLNKYDPAIAAELYPALDALKDRVEDPDLRVAALGELSVLSRWTPDLVSAEQSRSWVDELIAQAQKENPLAAARAYYERAGWTILYNSDDTSIEEDLTKAQKYAAAAGGPDGADRNAWIVYQRSNRALRQRDWRQAESLALAASTEFDSLGDRHGQLASQIVAARAELALGELTAADDQLAEVVESARRHGYKRQIADGLFWRGQAKIGNDDDDGRDILGTAAELYSALGDQNLSAVAKVSARRAVFIAGEVDDATARSLREELEQTSAETEKSTVTRPSPAY
jgi:DNA-binding MarR family transcriptional regulator